MVQDQSLILRLQSQDENAFSAVYDNYSGALYGVILRMCKDEELSQNLLQDTFMTIWDKAHTYDSEKGRFYTWAYRIAKNKALNYLRKPESLIQNEDLGVYENVAEEIKEPIDILKLTGSIKNLEAHHQEAIKLVYYNGLTHREAHEEMNVPLGTFKSYIKQALKILHKSYVKVIVLWIILVELFK
jgi:RNA polymerase sigma-70 factor (ECF subfamily)